MNKIIQQNVVFSDKNIGHVKWHITFTIFPYRIHTNVYIVHRTNSAGKIIFQQNVVNQYQYFPEGLEGKRFLKNLKINLIPKERGFFYSLKLNLSIQDKLFR